MEIVSIENQNNDFTDKQSERSIKKTKKSFIYPNRRFNDMPRIKRNEKSKDKKEITPDGNPLKRVNTDATTKFPPINTFLLKKGV